MVKRRGFSEGGWYHEHEPVDLGPFEPSLTIQSETDRVSLSSILSRLDKGGGFAPDVPQRDGVFADISDAPSYVEALTTVARANEMFAQLPAELRDRFANDPAKMLAFLDKEENIDEARKLGLAPAAPVPPPEPAPMKVEVVNTAAVSAPAS